MLEITTPAELQARILSADTALLDFWAPWCGPCRMMMPNLEALQKRCPDLTIGKVNVDENKELAKAFGLRSVPTVVLFRKGQVKGSLVGAQSLASLEKFVAEN